MELNQKYLQCRLCLRNKKFMFNIFKADDNTCNEIRKAIEDMMHLKITKMDGLPPTVCCDCCGRVMSYGGFKKMCMKSREIFWRRAQQRLIWEVGVLAPSEAAVVPYEPRGAGMYADTDEDDSQLSVNGIKQEPCEDAEPDRPDVNERELLPGCAPALQPNGMVDSTNPTSNDPEDGNLSDASTIVRVDEDSDFDDDSFHLRLSDASDGEESQARKAKKLKVSNDTEDSIYSLYGVQVKECSVILTRCDVEKHKSKYQALREGRQLRKRKATTATTSAESQQEAGPSSSGGPPYPCGDCWITFSSPEFLLRHKQFHHGTYCPRSIGELNKTTARVNEMNRNILSGVISQTKENAGIGMVKGVSERNLSLPEKAMSSEMASSMESVHNVSLKQSKTVAGDKGKRLPLGEKTCPDRKSSPNNGEVNDITPRRKRRPGNRGKRSGKKSYPCETCSRVFSKPYTLKVHKYIHDGTKPYPCGMCDLRFRTKELKERHEAYHSDEKPFSCNQCPKSYRLISSLRKHTLKHSDEKPYECKFCDKRFKRTDAVRQHERIHTGERRYKCDKCSQTFTDRSNLCAHNRIHTGERPYVCTVCGKTFQVSTTLKIHLKIHNRKASPGSSEGN